MSIVSCFKKNPFYFGDINVKKSQTKSLGTNLTLLLTLGHSFRKYKDFGDFRKGSSWGVFPGREPVHVNIQVGNIVRRTLGPVTLWSSDCRPSDDRHLVLPIVEVDGDPNHHNHPCQRNVFLGVPNEVSSVGSG